MGRKSPYPGTRMSSVPRPAVSWWCHDCQGHRDAEYDDTATKAPWQSHVLAMQMKEYVHRFSN